jgi:hypothetical protein
MYSNPTLCFASVSRPKFVGLQRLMNLIKKPLPKAVVALMLAALSPAALAATDTWSGASITSANWTDGLNWLPGVPSPNDALVFDGVLQLTNTNDTPANTQYNGLTFNSTAGAFVLNGNAINLGGDLIDNSANTETINLPLTLLQNTNANVVGGGTLNLNGAVTGGFAITTTGSGFIIMNVANSFNGLNINSGTVQGNVSGAYGLTTGTISLNGGTLRLGNVGNTAVTESNPVNVVTNSSITSTNKSNFIGGIVTGSANLSIVDDSGGTLSANKSWTGYTGTATVAPASGAMTFRLDTGFVAPTTGKFIFNSGATLVYRNGTNSTVTFSFGSLDMNTGSTLSGGSSAGGGTIVWDIGSKGDENTISAAIVNGSTKAGITKSGTAH